MRRVGGATAAVQALVQTKASRSVHLAHSKASATSQGAASLQPCGASAQATHPPADQRKAMCPGDQISSASCSVFVPGWALTSPILTAVHPKNSPHLPSIQKHVSAGAPATMYSTHPGPSITTSRPCAGPPQAVQPQPTAASMPIRGEALRHACTGDAYLATVAAPRPCRLTLRGPHHLGLQIVKRSRPESALQ